MIMLASVTCLGRHFIYELLKESKTMDHIRHSQDFHELSEVIA